MKFSTLSNNRYKKVLQKPGCWTICLKNIKYSIHPFIDGTIDQHFLNLDQK